MATTYDPRDPQYLDEADVRGELSRAFDVCHDCRACIDRCATFPTLFDLLDRFDDGDSGRLTPAEQDEVVESCTQCKACAADCPYVPGLHEWAVDIPRLFWRAEAMRVATAQRPLLRRPALWVLATPVLNRIVAGPPKSFRRRALTSLTGVAAISVRPPFSRRRFSTWFAARSAGRADEGHRQRDVTVFPTCLVEFHEPWIGEGLVHDYELAGIDCSLTAAGCCGSPWLDGGVLARFDRQLARNVRRLATEVRAGHEIVVAASPCLRVLQRTYVDYADPDSRPDAELVAAHVHDARRFLDARTDTSTA